MLIPHPGHMWAVDLGNSFTTHLSQDAPLTSSCESFIVSLSDDVVGNEHSNRASVTSSDHSEFLMHLLCLLSLIFSPGAGEPE